MLKCIEKSCGIMSILGFLSVSLCIKGSPQGIKEGKVFAQDFDAFTKEICRQCVQHENKCTEMRKAVGILHYFIHNKLYKRTNFTKLCRTSCTTLDIEKYF